MSAADRGLRRRMKTRKLGPSTPEVSLVGLGTNNFGGRTGDDDAQRVIDKALDCGVTLIDTADTYGNKGGSEEIIGRVLGPRRKQVMLATKFGLPMNEPESGGASRRYILQAAEASLRRLKTDWIDLYQQHRGDRKTPIEETLRALDDLVKAGKVRFIGCSNLSAQRIDEAAAVARQYKLAPFITCQDEYNLLDRSLERELVPAMQKHRLGLLPYFPLASGFLTGKYRRDAPPPPGTRLSRSPHHAEGVLNDRNWGVVEALGVFAARRGHTLLELAMSWLASRPFIVSIIAGATRPEQVEQNIAAVNWELTPDDLAEIDRVTA
jgi:aryl-alcohol dehydrogenase-like predicted oxidoreductase